LGCFSLLLLQKSFHYCLQSTKYLPSYPIIFSPITCAIPSNRPCSKWV